jgi:hypothetical protein
MPTPLATLATLVTSSPEIIGSTLSIDTTVLPFTITADTLSNPWAATAEFFPGNRIVDSNGNVQIATTHGFTGGTVPVWSTTPGGITVDGGVHWVFLGFPDTTRIEVKIYNQVFTFINGIHGFISTPVLTSFTAFTGSIAINPSVPETLLQIVGRNYDPSTSAVFQSNHAYSVGDQIIDPHGNVQTVLVAGISGNSAPSFSQTIGGQTPNGVGTLIWIMTGAPAVTPTVKINLIFFQTNDAVVIAPPSGVNAYKAEQNCKLEWAQPTFDGFLGVRVLLSTDPTGVTVPFTQFGSDVVNNITRTQNVVIGSETTTAVDGNTTTITTTQTTLPVNFSSVNIAPSDVQNAEIFYAMLSTVIQDPNTNAVFESQQNGPITCGFVNLHVVSPTDFLALQRKEDIAGRMIQQITRIYPDLDLTPRSETRDIVIDPVSLELANMSVREWFSRVSTSISAISQVDDADGDGFSDPFDQSPLKQQLARAYGLSAADTQTLVNRQFDILGEQAGVSRGGAAASVVTLTFFSFVRPTTTVVFPIGIRCVTVPDAQTPALNFATRASATIDPASADSFYNPEFGWFQVQVPAECGTNGSIGNVGAGTIRSVMSGAPNGWGVTNLVPADFGQDTQINSKFAANIQDSLVAGKDSGTRFGYLKAARATPGVVEARVVAAGDLEMLRDWDPVRQKHVFGTVDIYTRGTSFSEQDTDAAFTYQNTGTYGAISTYLAATLLDVNLMKFTITNFSQLKFGVYTALEFQVQRGGNTFYFGMAKAQFDNVFGTFVIDPNEGAYQYTGDVISKVRVPLVLNGSNATNRTALQALASTSTNFNLNLIARLQSPLQITPTFQPVLTATSVTGETGQTGVIPTAFVRLIHSSDFLLQGGSNNAGDEVAVNSTSSSPQTKTLTMNSSTVVIDTAMDVTTNSNGTPGGVVSVRSADLSRLYTFNTDYNIVPSAPQGGSYQESGYRTYSLNLISKTFGITSVAIDGSNNLTVTAPGHDFVPGAQVTFNNVVNASFLNAATVTVSSVTPTTFTCANVIHAAYGSAADTGNAVGQNIAPGAVVSITYNKFVLFERLILVTGESQTLNGTVPTPLGHEGFVHNTWLPESYGNTTLSLDGAVFNPDGTIDVGSSTGLVGAQVPHDSRYVKVTFNGTVMKEGIDYTLTVDPVSGAASLARILTGHIGDAQTVVVSYFTTEVFKIATEFPAFVETLAANIANTKHAAADVLVKAMVQNGVDVSLTIELAASATPEVMDPKIRTIISIVMDNATKKLTQAELIRQVKAITGVANVHVPLTKFAKTDGAYDIDVIVPTGTDWLRLNQDPAFSGQPFPVNSFITQFAVLPDSTIPSGGIPDAFVGLLFEGQAFRRALSVQDFFTSAVPSFYIIGSNDKIDSTHPLTGYQQKILLKEDPTVLDPTARNYRVTYQVFNEGGTKDIEKSSTEYFVPGRVTINFVTGS